MFLNMKILIGPLVKTHFFFLYIYMYGDPEMKFLGHNLCIHPLWLSPNCLPKWLRQGAL